MTKIVYEDKGDGKGANLSMIGNTRDITRGVIRMLTHLQLRAGLDIERLCVVLPTLINLERMVVDEEASVVIVKDIAVKSKEQDHE